MIEPQKEIMFDFDEVKKRKIGHIRCQYGEKEQIANQWCPNSSFSPEKNLDYKEINTVCDYLQFEWIKNFENMITLCDWEEDAKETNYFLEHGDFCYWIRLNPTFGTSEYNVYINIYLKEESYDY